MNLGQILEVIVGKSVMNCNDYIKSTPENIESTITWLNEAIIKNINPTYYQKIKNEIINNLNDEEFKNRFIKSITDTNLFIEAPCFATIDIRKLIKNIAPYKESIIIKKKLIDYMKQNLKLNLPVITNDIIIPNVFCGPMYIQKLSKITSKSINARDLGPVKSITKQPVKGRAKSGGSKLGQMESIESYKMALSYGNI